MASLLYESICGFESHSHSPKRQREVIMFGDIFNKVVDITLQPVNDSLEILQGLTEGEIRAKAAARLGADVVAGMAVSEIIEYLSELE